jgi:hypothetical protein
MTVALGRAHDLRHRALSIPGGALIRTLGDGMNHEQTEWRSGASGLVGASVRGCH